MSDFGSEGGSKGTNEVGVSDKRIVRDKITVKSAYYEFTANWKNACRILLNRYLEVKNERSSRKFSIPALLQEIMSPHHTYDDMGRLLKEETNLTRNDLGHYLNYRTNLSSSKFRYIDYFINSTTVWQDPLFSQARRQAMRLSLLDKISSLKNILETSSEDQVNSNENGAHRRYFFTLSSSHVDDFPNVEEEGPNDQNILIPVFLELEYLDKNAGAIKVAFIRRSSIGQTRYLHNADALLPSLSINLKKHRPYVVGGYFAESGSVNRQSGSEIINYSILLSDQQFGLSPIRLKELMHKFGPMPFLALPRTSLSELAVHMKEVDNDQFPSETMRPDELELHLDGTHFVFNSKQDISLSNTKCTRFNFSPINLREEKITDFLEKTSVPPWWHTLEKDQLSQMLSVFSSLGIDLSAAAHAIEHDREETIRNSKNTNTENDITIGDFIYDEIDPDEYYILDVLFVFSNFFGKSTEKNAHSFNDESILYMIIEIISFKYGDKLW